MQVSVDLVPRDRDRQHRGFVLNFQIQMKCAADGGKERERAREPWPSCQVGHTVALRRAISGEKKEKKKNKI